MIEIRDEQGQLRQVRITAQDLVEAGLQSPAGVLLPGHPLFEVSLASTLPPGWREAGLRKFGNVATFVFRPGSVLMQPVSEAELMAYLDSGEWQARERETAA
jgi:hypothetical protein